MLKDYVKQSMNEIRQSEQFMGHFEINKLFETIKGASNYQIAEFERILNGLVYNFSNLNDTFASDYSNVETIARYLEDYIRDMEHNLSKIRISNFKSLKLSLEDIKQRLEPN